MSLDIRITVDADRKQKLKEIDAAVDANKTTMQLRIMNKAIDDEHFKLFGGKK